MTRPEWFKLSNQISVSIQHTTLNIYDFEIAMHDSLCNHTIREYVDKNTLERLVEFISQQKEREVIK